MTGRAAGEERCSAIESLGDGLLCDGGDQG